MSRHRADGTGDTTTVAVAPPATADHSFAQPGTTDGDMDFWGLTHTQRRHHQDRVWNHQWQRHLTGRDFSLTDHILSVAGWVIASTAAVMLLLLAIALTLNNIRSGG